MATRLLLAVLLLALGGPTAVQAAPPDVPAGHDEGLAVSYVPLDSRPFPSRTPVAFGRAALAEVDHPPAAWLGSFMTPGRVARVADWWEQSAADTDVSVLNVAMLTVGGLVPSRECDSATTETALARLDVLERVARDHPDHRIVATHSIQRLASNLYGTPPGTYAGRVRDWGILRDRVLNLGHEDLRGEYEQLAAEIPREVRDDHLCARARNHAINEALVDLAADGVIDRLVLGVDDAHEFGLHRAERVELEARIDARGVDDQVDVYVGTDVNGSLLLVGEVVRDAGLAPTVAVEYSGMPGHDWVAPYQDQPYAEVVDQYVTELGGRVTTDTANADVHLLANTPGPGDRDAFHDRVATLATRGEVVVVGDDVNPGTTDEGLYDALTDRMQLAHLGGYSGWNVGAALAQGIARWSVLERAEHGRLGPGRAAEPSRPGQRVRAMLVDAATAHLQVLAEAFTHEHHYRNFVRSQVRDFAVDAGDDPQWFQFVHDDAEALAVRHTRPRAEAMFDAEFVGEPVAIGRVGRDLVHVATTGISAWEWALPWPRYQELVATPTLDVSSDRDDFDTFVRASATPSDLRVHPSAAQLPTVSVHLGRATSQPVRATVSVTADHVSAPPRTVTLHRDGANRVTLDLEATTTLSEGTHELEVVVDQLLPRSVRRTTTVPLRLHVTVPNLALATSGVTATADSVFSSYVPELAIDGDRTGIRSRWISGTTEPHHLTLDFPQPRTFDEVSLFHYGGYELRDYTVEVRRDGTWDPVVEVSGNTESTTVHDFPAVTADGLRLTVTDSRDTRARLYELEVRCRSRACT